MPTIDYAEKEINFKIVYYGPSFGGKTTNLKYIYEKISPKVRGKMITMKTEEDRTLFFDFLPIEFGEIKGFKTRFHLYTVPGQVFYNITRKLILRNVDGIVFVADSKKDRIADNVESLNNLKENLADQGDSLEEIPWVLQLNKRDLEDAAPVEELLKVLREGDVPYFESIAIEGKGVFETLKCIIKLVVKKAKEKEYGG